MARGKKNEDEAEVRPMDQEALRGFARQIDELQAQADDANDAYKTAKSAVQAKWKEFKKAGGKNEVLKDIMAKRRMDEGDRLQFEQDRLQYAAWMGLPLGTQPSLFGDALPAGKPPTDEAIRQQQEETGYLAGKAGDEAEDNPHEMGSVAHVAWHKGWMRGNREARKAQAQADGKVTPSVGKRGKAAAAPDNITGSPLN